MAVLGSVGVVPNTTGTLIRNVLIEEGGSTKFQQVVAVAGGTGDIIEPLTSAPASSAVAWPFRLVTGTTGLLYGYGLISTGLNAAAIDPRQATIVGGTSGAGLGTVVSTAAGSAAIDPRQSTIIGATSGAGLGTITSTAVGAAAIDPRQVTVVAATSGAVVWTVGAGSSGVTGTTLISTGLSGAAIDPRIIAAQSTAVVLGAVAVQQSTGYMVTTRSYLDSTTNYNLKYFYSTGTVAPTASTMQTLHVVTNLSSGTDASSFNVAAGKIFRIDHAEMSIRCTSGALLYADFAIRAVTTTGGTTGTNPPVFYHRLVAASPSSAAVEGGEEFAVSGLQIDLPSSASYGVSIVANSCLSNECTFSFGGKEYTI